MSVRPHPKQKTHPEDYNNKRGRGGYGNVWLFDYYKDGKRIQQIFVGTEAEAYEIERVIRQIPSISSSNPRIRDKIDEYLRWLKMHRAEKTYKDFVNSIKLLKPHFWHLPVSHITEHQIDQFKEARGKARAANKELDYLKSVISFMVRKKYAQPLSFKIEKLPYKRPIPYIPTPQDIEKVIANLPYDNRQAIAILMCEGGCRFQEAANLMWPNVNLDNGTAILEKTKGDKPRIIIIPPRV